MEDLRKILTEQPFLAKLDEKHIQLLVGCASNVVFKEGEYIFREGQPADSFYIVRHGKVMVETFIPQKGPLVIDSLEVGDILGWSWLLSPYRWHFDARVSVETRAIAFDGKCLRAKLEDDHDLGFELMKRFASVISERLEATRLQLMDVYGAYSKK